MNKFVLTIASIILLISSLLGQTSTERHLVITGRVIDTILVEDYFIQEGVKIYKPIHVKIYVISNDKIMVYDSADGLFDIPLAYGIDYKIIFSKTGYKSKMLLAEVKNSKKPDEFNYKTPIEVALEAGFEDEDEGGVVSVPGKEVDKELKPIGKIFYNSKEDYYDSISY